MELLLTLEPTWGTKSLLSNILQLRVGGSTKFCILWPGILHVAQSLLRPQRQHTSEFEINHLHESRMISQVQVLTLIPIRTIEVRSIGIRFFWIWIWIWLIDIWSLLIILHLPKMYYSSGRKNDFAVLASILFLVPRTEQNSLLQKYIGNKIIVILLTFHAFVITF